MYACVCVCVYPREVTCAKAPKRGTVDSYHFIRQTLLDAHKECCVCVCVSPQFLNAHKEALAYTYMYT